MLSVMDGFNFTANNMGGEGITEEFIIYLYREVIKAKNKFAQTEAIRNIECLLKKIDKNDL